ncbi:RidA family protein [Roseovarius indicus]|uniref:RidA family protein n=1 Tax=Roseovarius indicus TaxID=540747 RepID=UPI0007D9ED3C|nr:RidA family protein [Roseovarius indicus]OAN98717.1 hypothetical protein A8B76_01360 [Roseovarius indicus]
MTDAITHIHPNNDAGVSRGVATEHFVYAAGLAIDGATMRRVPEADTIENETRICLQRIEDTLAEAGLSLKDVAKTSCWVSDEAYRFEFIHAYRDYFAPGPFPSRGTVSASLAGDCRVQIEVTAVRPEPTDS